MSIRTHRIPEDLIAYLGQVEAFSVLPIDWQQGLAGMALELQEKVGRKHRKVEDAFSFGRDELREVFGKGGFTKANDQVKFFTVSSSYTFGDEGITKAYIPTPLLRGMLKDYTATICEYNSLKAHTHMISKGKRLRALPNAVQAKSKKGVTLDKAIIKEAAHLNLVRVDLPTMAAYLTYLEWLRDEAGMAGLDLSDIDQRVKRVINSLQNLVAGARNNLRHGSVIHTYEISDAGRYYATGVSLQNAPKEVRRIALAGQWDYDFQNAHYSILYQLAQKLGIDCPSIAYYLNNKAEVRQGLADEAGVPIDVIKYALIALIYGAKASTWRKAAITKAFIDSLGSEEAGILAASRLYASEVFSGILEDLRRSRRKIIRSCKTTQRSILNACGKPMPKDATPEQKLAHLLQGLEAQALSVAIYELGERISLLIHDGFVCEKRLKKAEKEKLLDKIQAVTEIRFEMDEKEFRLDKWETEAIKKGQIILEDKGQDIKTPHTVGSSGKYDPKNTL